MKTLLVLRHGKSSWDYPDLADHDRPLKKRGLRDAPRMGRLLKEKGLVPDLIVASTAARARRTAELVAEHSGYAGSIQRTQLLYHGSPEDFVKVLNRVADDRGCVMIVGHNPDFETLLELLTGQETRMPTAALARISLPITRWRDLGPDTRGRLEALWRPKQLGAG